MAKISVEVRRGGRDGGFLSWDGKVYEKNINLIIALEIKRHLERHGQDVFLSRNGDYYINPKELFDKVKAWKPNLHISVHCNALDGYGFEISPSSVSTYKINSTVLCEEILREVKLLEHTGYSVNKSSYLFSSLPCVSALCSLGYLDNPMDYDKFNTENKWKKFARAYAKGILGYLGYPWMEEILADG